MLYLIYLMGFVGKGELLAALYTASFMLALLVAAFLYFKYVLKDPARRRTRRCSATCGARSRRMPR